MPPGRVTDVIERLCTSALGARPGMTDGQLLERFVGRHDGAAFAALVRRHGPMVWGVCRRILHRHHDAEDAFQATFLVLVRRAGSLVPRQMVAGWLYAVAHRTALKARALAAQRNRRQRELAEFALHAERDRDATDDLRCVLHRELAQLPARYRTAIVLCDLEEKTRREVALQLGVPEGTLSGWLTRGRRMLAKRLSRQDAALASGVLSLLLTQRATSESLPALAVVATLEAAAGTVAGDGFGGPVSQRVANLTEGVLRAMLWSKIRPVAVLLFALAGVLGLAVGIGVHPGLAEQPGEPGPRPAPPSLEDHNVTTEEYYQYLVQVTLLKVPATERKPDVPGVSISELLDKNDHPEIGAEKKLATPQLLTREGRPASFFVGKELPVAGKGPEVEYLPDGVSVHVTVTRSGNKLRADSVLEATHVERSSKTKAHVDGRSSRSVCEVKLGEEITLDLADAGSEKHYRARIKVAEEEWVRRTTRRRTE